MFTWICPQCGKEVPPHETECPHCAAGASAPQPAAAPQAAAEPPPPAPPQPVYVVAPARHPHGWLVAVLVAVGLMAAGAGAYYFLLPSSRSAGATAGQKAPLEPAAAAGAAAPATNRLAKFIEATGFRITEDERKRLNIRFLIVNHSPADIGDLAGKVHLKTTEGKSIADFDFKTTRLGPYESVEFTVLVSTTLRAYEVPDWQFLTADLEITSPPNL
jgi:hypothetical protein